MLTLRVPMPESELAAELDGVIRSKQERVNQFEPTFGQRIVKLVLSPEYAVWHTPEDVRTHASITGVRPAKSKGYYRSEVISDSRTIYMTSRQAERAWEVLEEAQLVGVLAAARMRHYRKVDALEQCLMTALGVDARYETSGGLHVHDIAETIVESLDNMADRDTREPRFSHAAYRHTLTMDLTAADVPAEICEIVGELMDMLIAFHVDFRK